MVYMIGYIDRQLAIRSVKNISLAEASTPYCASYRLKRASFAWQPNALTADRGHAISYQFIFALFGLFFIALAWWISQQGGCSALFLDHCIRVKAFLYLLCSSAAAASLFIAWQLRGYRESRRARYREQQQAAERAHEALSLLRGCLESTTAPRIGDVAVLGTQSHLSHLKASQNALFIAKARVIL